MADQDIYGFKYLFNVESKRVEGGFSKISGISEEIEVVDLRDGTDPFQVRKIKGTNQGGILTLERGVIYYRTHLFEWFKDVKKARTPYWADVDVKLNMTNARPSDDPAFALRFFKGWPSRYELGELDAKTSEIAVESLNVVHEGIDWL